MANRGFRVKKLSTVCFTHERLNLYKYTLFLASEKNIFYPYRTKVRLCEDIILFYEKKPPE